MLPELHFVKNENNCLEIIFKNTHHSFLNAIRRIVLTEIPTLAFDQILFEKNSSNMNEDMLGHRISLLPIQTSREIVERFEYKSSCPCKIGCEKCEICFSLDVCNTDTNEVKHVYCKDLRTTDERQGVSLLKYNRNNNGILLCTLLPSQRIQLTTKAVKGNAKQHQKWSPVNVCHFQALDKQTYSFYLECNHNVDTFDILKEAFAILEKKFNDMKKKLKLYKQTENKYIFPYCDTIMQPFVHDILENFDIDLCYYKRGHFLQRKPTSDFSIDTGKSYKKEDIEMILKNSLNIMISNLNLLENQYNQIYFQD